ncbi:MAG: SDR family NAD(P)-dependent oxidoreductase, partial [Myxococcota bacterium]
MDITSQAAIVTGGASGLGEGTARRLAADGAKVALFDLNEERGEAVAKEIGGIFCKVDVSDEASIDAGFARARDAHGQERVLVNCAGIGMAEKTAGRSKSTGEIKMHAFANFKKVININLIGSFTCASRSAAGMMALEPLGDSGRLVRPPMPCAR